MLISVNQAIAPVATGETAFRDHDHMYPDPIAYTGFADGIMRPIFEVAASRAM